MDIYGIYAVFTSLRRNFNTLIINDLYFAR